MRSVPRSARRWSGGIAAALGTALVLSVAVAGSAVAHGPEDVDPKGDFLSMLLAQDDGVASLPVSKGPFPDTRNMRFLSQIAPDDLGALPIPGTWAKGMMNDIWGWTSPAGEEYALLTNSGGVAFVRVTDPENPVFVGRLASQRPFNIGNLWGDPGVFGRYGYFVNEIVDSQVVVVDMAALDSLGPAATPDTDLPAPTFTFSTGGYRSAHNIQINEETGYAYVAGVRLRAGANACGLAQPPRFNTLIYDLNTNPTNPDVAACLPDVGEHDFYPVVYDGPDEDYQGREIVFVFDGRDRALPTGQKIGGFTQIWDATDKGNIEVIANFRVPGLVFSHNGWTTEEQDYLFIGDEVDELVQAGWSATAAFAQPVADPTNMPQTGTYILDIRDLDDPVVVDRYTDGTVGLDHNFIVKGDKLYLASYTSGTRVLQINRDASGTVSLAPYAHMDTEPRLPGNILNINQEEKFGNAFLGQWGIYPLFDSGTIIASDINNGLIVMKLSDAPCKGMRCSL